MKRKIERRRTVRIKRSALLKNNLQDIDRPAIKFAETTDELEQTFSLAYKEYSKSGYIPEPKPSRLLFSIYNIHPETMVFIAKSYLTVISTLTLIFDSEMFGLPMDVIYREELDALRSQKRKVAELSALVTPKKARWKNIFMHLCQIMYQYSFYKGIDDLCITVNPKHVRFYKSIFLFEDLGPEKHYPKVNAPAVALRLNMNTVEKKLKDAYSAMDFECNLHTYFHKIAGKEKSEDNSAASIKEKPLDIATARYFLSKDTSILKGLSAAQRKYFESIYRGLEIDQISIN
ncbi:MAG: hypothetical protein JRD93_18220 [Deltaproteobacteria bacterium]|nr:hypothetical protein [Deltaproteobacteria bacterium]MBW2663855.1 hypothetical protein [Deltaproteobacteria bacterium]